MARLVLSQGENVGLASGTYTVFGTTGGAERVDISGGNVSLDPSFNAGGDDIYLNGNAGSFTATRNGSSVTLTNGTITVNIPFGTVGANIHFLDATRSLVFDTGTDNRPELGGQGITSTATPVTPGSGGGGGALTVSAGVASIDEGNTGTKLLTFQLTLNHASTTSTTVNYSTSDGTAVANNDYVPVAGTVTFAAGQTVATVSVPIVGDTVVELNETFNLVLTSAEATVTGGVGIGTIVNDDIGSQLTAGNDLFTGTTGDDQFYASNNQLNAGDNIKGLAGNDTLFVSTDSSIQSQTFSGFVLNFVENFVVTNDSTANNGGYGGDHTDKFDLSGSIGLKTVSSDNSSASVAFNQIANALDSVIINNLTNSESTANVTVQFQDAVVVGASDSIFIKVTDSTADTVTIGRVGDSNGGIETVNLDVTGAAGAPTSIQQLNTDLTTLNITGNENLTINNSLNSSVQTIDASKATGDLDIDFTSTTNDVTFTGSQGADTVYAGYGSDKITTFGKDDYISAGDGNNVVNAGAGNNQVYAGYGNDTVTTLGGNDYISVGDGTNVVDAGDGNNTVYTGTGNDKITTGAGADFVYAGGGNNIVDTGAGDDYVNMSAGNFDKVSTGAGNDIVFAVGAFDASNNIDLTPRDNLDFGTQVDAAKPDQYNTVGDTLIIGAGSADVNFTNVTGLEVLTITTNGTTSFNDGDKIFGNSQAEEAGIRTVNLNGGYGNDTLDAGFFSRGLTINSFSGATSTITTGQGNDVFNFKGSLDNTDVLNAGAGSDTLNLDGKTSVNTTSLFTGFETINLDTGRNETVPTTFTYNLTLDNDNAPTSNGLLTINGSGLAADTDGKGPFGPETATIDTSAVSAYNLNITTGAAADTVRLGTSTSTVSTGAGDDYVTTSATGANTIDTGDGIDRVDLNGGTGTFATGNDLDTVVFKGGTYSGSLGAGDDVLDAVIAATNLTIDGGTGTDYFVTDGPGRTVTDAEFGGVTNFEVFVNDTFGFATTNTLGLKAQAAGILTVVDADGGAASTYDLGVYTKDVTVDLKSGYATTGSLAGTTFTSGGNDTVTTGSGNDTVILNTGTNNVSLGTGNDTVVIHGAELDALDKIAGGAGTDTIVLDNTKGAATAVVDLSFVTSIEAFTIKASGDVTANVTDKDDNSITFSNSTVNPIDSVTVTTVDASALTDPDDSLTVTLAATLTDPDFSFVIKGAGAGVDVIVDKQNIGLNNNVDFQGAASDDTLIINGNDLGSTVSFSGGTGLDTIKQSGGKITDDGFLGVKGVEVLSGTGGGALNATLGAAAQAAGLTTVLGTTGNDKVTIGYAAGVGFSNPLTVSLGGGGNDTFNGAASPGTFTFNGTAGELDAKDVVSGGSGKGDILNIIGGGTNAPDITNFTGVETVNVLNTAGIDTITLTLGNVNTGSQTINATGFTDGTAGSAVDGLFTVVGGTSTVNLTVNAGVEADKITTGSGNDVISTGAGTDIVNSGAGNDTVTASGSLTVDLGNGLDLATATNSVTLTGTGILNVTGTLGADTITSGSGNDIIATGAGNDIINAGDGNNNVLAGAGADTIVTGSGNDQILGGAGIDMITTGAGNDVIYYASGKDSSTSTGRDVITDFTSGSDHINILDVFETGTGGNVAVQQIVFGGNVNLNNTDPNSVQGAVHGGDGKLDAVFDVGTHTLWFDLDDNGILNGNDLQITLSGTNAITGADIYEGLNAGNGATTYGWYDYVVNPGGTFTAAQQAIA